MKLSINDVKTRTIELYDSLPQDFDTRILQHDVRDEIIELNYSFFGYVASHTFVNSSYWQYEDKLQTVSEAFCKMWWKYKWKGGPWIDEYKDASGITHKVNRVHRGFRSDVSFSAFFKLRLGEELERAANEVKYSLRRALCMEVGDKLGKHWGQVKYEDLNSVELAPDKMDSLRAMFGSMYVADLSTYEVVLPAPEDAIDGVEEFARNDYDSIERLLIQHMVLEETSLTDKKLMELSELYTIEYQVLQDAYPKALQILYDRLKRDDI